MTVEPLDIARLSVQEARALTDRIRQSAETLWELLAEAHDREAWAALKYGSFKAYVETEFGMSRRHAYRLLDQAKVIEALTEAAGVTHGSHLDINEREARELGPHLDLVVKNVADATRDTEPERRTEAARAAINQTRSHLRERRTVEVESANDRDALDEEKDLPEPFVVEIDEPRREPVIVKPDLGDGVSHPARYGDNLLDIFARLLKDHESGPRVLDPFAGTGKIHQLVGYGYTTTGIEIQAKWARLHPATIQADACDLPFGDNEFDAIVTSPTYGNRLADHYNSSDPHLRRSYRFDLGEELEANNSGSMQWGREYRDLHRRAWPESVRVLKPGGLFILNIKDHVRNGRRQNVAGWHVSMLSCLGLVLLEHEQIETRNLKQGANSHLRFDEQIYTFRKGDYE